MLLDCPPRFNGVLPVSHAFAFIALVRYPCNTGVCLWEHVGNSILGNCSPPSPATLGSDN